MRKTIKDDATSLPLQDAQQQRQGPEQGTHDSRCVPWSSTAVPYGPQSRQTTLRAHGTEHAQTGKVGKVEQDIEKSRDEDGAEYASDNMNGMCNVKAEEEKVCTSQVEDVDREGIPAHVEAQKPQHCDISCQPNQANDDDKKIQGKFCGITGCGYVVTSIYCCDISPPGWASWTHA